MSISLRELLRGLFCFVGGGAEAFGERAEPRRFAHQLLRALCKFDDAAQVVIDQGLEGKFGSLLVVEVEGDTEIVVGPSGSTAPSA
jgi:hypothetical protein